MTASPGQCVHVQINHYVFMLRSLQVSPCILRDHVNEAILDSQKISLSTAERWLRKLGYQPRIHRNDIYMDGHEREDVVVVRRAFLERVQVLEG